MDLKIVSRSYAAAAFLLGLATLLSPTSLFAAEYPPTDHGGADLILADGDVIWGTHSGVGTFAIPAGTKVVVKPYDGTNRIGDWKTETGTFTLIAQHVSIEGTLDATGAGFTGGGGGGGSCGTNNATVGNGGVSKYPVGLAGEDLVAAKGNPPACTPFWPAGQTCYGTVGGYGGHGDGTDGGDVAGLTSTDWAAASGGYASGRGVGSNEDESEDESLSMGSGGSGGRGGAAYGGAFGSVSFGGYGGAAGGSGGGMISLTATQSITLGDAASIRADGTMGLGRTATPTTTGNGSNGRDAILPNPSGSISTTDWNISGGAGSGGGILLKCETADGLSLSPNAVVRTLGGGDLVQNGGTVKLFYTPSEYMTSLPAIYAGHRLVRTVQGVETTSSSSTENWAEYN